MAPGKVTYRREGAAEVESNKRLADRVIAALRRRPDAMAELLWGLLPSDELLRSLYLRTEHQSGYSSVLGPWSLVLGPEGAGHRALRLSDVLL